MDILHEPASFESTNGFTTVVHRREKKNNKHVEYIHSTKYIRPEIGYIFTKIKNTLQIFGAYAAIIYGPATSHKKEIGDIDLMVFWRYSYLPENLRHMKNILEDNIGIPIDFVIMQRNAGSKKYRPSSTDEFFFQNVVSEGRIMFVEDVKSKPTKGDLVYGSTKVLKL
jgi:predicted nucleotidyltransferase